MKGSKPKLVAVDGGRPTEASGETTDRQGAVVTPHREGRSVGVWILAGLLALALLAAAIQTQRVGALTGQIEALTADLGRARTSLAAYRGHLDQVRSSVADLQERLGGLGALVNRDPLPAPGEPASIATPEANPED